VVAKLGVPFEPELAMGAIGEGSARVLNTAVTGPARISADALAAVEQAERTKLEAQVARYRRGRHRIDLDGRVAVVVDDGVATGSTARAACAVARELGAAAGPVVSLPVTVPLRPAASRSAWCSTGAGLRSAAPHRCGTASPGTG